MFKNGKNIPQKYCCVQTAQFLKYVWPFHNMNERVNNGQASRIF